MWWPRQGRRRRQLHQTKKGFWKMQARARSLHDQKGLINLKGNINVTDPPYMCLGLVPPCIAIIPNPGSKTWMEARNTNKILGFVYLSQEHTSKWKFFRQGGQNHDLRQCHKGAHIYNESLATTNNLVFNIGSITCTVSWILFTKPLMVKPFVKLRQLFMGC